MSHLVPSEALVAAARALKGVPFRHQGRSITGLDCLGLLVCSCIAASLRVEDRTDYGRLPDVRRMVKTFNDQLIRLPRTTILRPGMVVIFHDQNWIHCGLISVPDSVIHSRGPEGVGSGVVEHRIDDQSWRPRIKGLWRHPDMVWER